MGVCMCVRSLGFTDRSVHQSKLAWWMNSTPRRPGHVGGVERRSSSDYFPGFQVQEEALNS